MIRKKLCVVFVTAALLSGCAVVRVRDRQHEVYTTIYSPAWPWQDVNQTINRLTVNARTNSLSISLRDQQESTVGATNLAPIIEAIIEGIVRGFKY